MTADVERHIREIQGIAATVQIEFPDTPEQDIIEEVGMARIEELLLDRQPEVALVVAQRLGIDFLQTQ